MQEITEKLFDMRDLGYRDFHCRLMPTVPRERVIGVRTPELRKFAKEVALNGLSEKFICELPHRYYEENNLHAFLIEKIGNFDDCIRETEKFLPHIDNWATCDLMRPKCFSKNSERLLPYIEKWMSSGHTYTVRFGIEMLMLFYLDEKFEEKYLFRVAEIRSDEYYVNMMIAWFFATALSKQYRSAVQYLEKRYLPPWVHNKTVQKAMESYRISDEKKGYLKTLRLK